MYFKSKEISLGETLVLYVLSFFEFY